MNIGCKPHFLLQFVMISCLFLQALHWLQTCCDSSRPQNVGNSTTFQDPMVSFTYVYLASFLIDQQDCRNKKHSGRGANYMGSAMYMTVPRSLITYMLWYNICLVMTCDIIFNSCDIIDRSCV